MKKTKSRFAALKEFARRRRRRRKPQNRRDMGTMGGMAGLFAPNTNPRKLLDRESPIASLKLLQAQQRQLTVDAVVLSDEESGVQGGISDNDEEFSDSSNELTSVRNCDMTSSALATSRRKNKNHHHKVPSAAAAPMRFRHDVSSSHHLDEEDEHTGLMYHSDRRDNKGSSRWGPLCGHKPNGKAHLQKKIIVPDIVIDDMSVTVANHGSEKRPRTPKPDNSDQVPGYINSHGEPPKQDNIMWL